MRNLVIIRSSIGAIRVDPASERPPLEPPLSDGSFGEERGAEGPEGGRAAEGLAARELASETHGGGRDA